MTVKIYGIKNCDTMKKAFRWLDENGVAYEFHDYKKQGVDGNVLRQAIAEHGWEQVINSKGTTWRQLPDAVKKTMDADGAVKTALENPSLIKRPLLAVTSKTYLGFDGEKYGDLLI